MKRYGLGEAHDSRIRSGRLREKCMKAIVRSHSTLHVGANRRGALRFSDKDQPEMSERKHGED
jgi:hypothetical protein